MAKTPPAGVASWSSSTYAKRRTPPPPIPTGAIFPFFLSLQCRRYIYPRPSRISCPGGHFLRGSVRLRRIVRQVIDMPFTLRS